MRDIWEIIAIFVINTCTIDTNRWRAILVNTTSRRKWTISITNEVLLLNHIIKYTFCHLFVVKENLGGKQLTVIQVNNTANFLLVIVAVHSYMCAVNNIELTVFQWLVLVKRVRNEYSLTTCHYTNQIDYTGPFMFYLRKDVNLCQLFSKYHINV